jgi:DNA primase
MTVEEIKQQYSMQDILDMYGIRKNRAGFIHCPFHQGDRTASCKIYPKDFHCHACGANGDIFSFVQQMEHCSFKDAFKRLGGSYETKTDRERDLYHYKLQKAKESRIRREKRLIEQKKMVLQSLHENRLLKDHMEVFSDAWCRAVNGFERDLIALEEINNELRGNYHDS